MRGEGMDNDRSLQPTLDPSTARPSRRRRVTLLLVVALAVLALTLVVIPVGERGGQLGPSAAPADYSGESSTVAPPPSASVAEPRLQSDATTVATGVRPESDTGGKVHQVTVPSRAAFGAHQAVARHLRGEQSQRDTTKRPRG